MWNKKKKQIVINIIQKIPYICGNFYWAVDVEGAVWWRRWMCLIRSHFESLTISIMDSRSQKKVASHSDVLRPPSSPVKKCSFCHHSFGDFVIRHFYCCYFLSLIEIKNCISYKINILFYERMWSFELRHRFIGDVYFPLRSFALNAERVTAIDDFQTMPNNYKRHPSQHKRLSVLELN